MDSTVRRENFSRLITRRFGGSHAAAAKALALSPGRITQLLDDANPFGERAARSIEEKLELPIRYLDRNGAPQLDVAPGPSPASLSVAGAIEQLGALLVTIDPIARKAIAPLLSTLAQDPQQAEQIGRYVEGLLAGSTSKRRAA